MTKESTSQKPSPRFFRDILGQERVLGYLKAALSRGRLAHAYLFLGPEGVGKASIAQALAEGRLPITPYMESCYAVVNPACSALSRSGTHHVYLENRRVVVDRKGEPPPGG